jgi:S-DNA-T family DNA segregation ATPase FtsK/SpoIIIE
LDEPPGDAASRGGLARLVLVVDEFALLAAQLPEFVPGLVDIAQRGRSLGVHLVLATQRPAGVVDAKIRANTNLRIALRVQDDADSIDVIGTREAALIPRHAPGRAIARFGVDELIAFQTAPAGAAAARPAGLDSPLTVRPFVAARSLSALERRVVAAAPGPADTATPPGDAGQRGLVGAVAAAAPGRTPPRRPYVEPLPDRVDAAMLDEGGPGTADAGVVLGLEDRPAEQRHRWRRWRPAEDGCLALYGMAGAGTSSALLTLALGLARAHGPDDVHLYAIDADAGLLRAIAPLPHTGAVVSTGEPARLVRLARLLDRELERRRRAGASRSTGGDSGRPPTIVVLVDNVGSLRQALDATGTAELWGAVERLLRDGPGLGIVTAVSATAERDLPPSASAHIAERLVLRQPAGSAYASFGFRPTEVPRMVPGRALCPGAGTEMQLLAPPAEPNATVDAVARSTGPAGRRPPPRVDPLPARVDVVQLLARAAVTPSGWRVPVGIGLHDADTLDVELRPGAPFVIVGPAGSGRTTVLGAMATSVRAVDPGAALYCLAPRSELIDALALVPAGPDDVADWVAAVVGDPRRRLLLVDDADAMDGPSLERLAALDAPGLVVVIAGRPDGLRCVGHWSRPWIRRGRGIVLSPVPADGDVLGVALPARLGRCPRGQGLLVDDGSVVPLLCASGPRATT